MKNAWMLLLLMGVSQCAKAQVAGGTMMELVYEYANIGLGEKRSVRVLYRNLESLTTFSPKDSLSGTPQKDFSISGEDEQGRQVYINSITGEVVFRDFVPQVGGDFAACRISDPMKPMKWTYSSEVKQIGKYLCGAASTDFRGRKYVAWYTESIPISHGPWKFYGLPGAIVEVHSMDRNILFTLLRVGPLTGGEIKRPGNAKAITMVEYIDRKEKALSEFLSSLASKLPRGAQISMSSTGDYNLEVDFSDVKK